MTPIEVLQLCLLSPGTAQIGWSYFKDEQNKNPQHCPLWGSRRVDGRPKKSIKEGLRNANKAFKLEKVVNNISALHSTRVVIYSLLPRFGFMA